MHEATGPASSQLMRAPARGASCERALTSEAPVTMYRDPGFKEKPLWLLLEAAFAHRRITSLIPINARRSSDGSPVEDNDNYAKPLPATPHRPRCL